MSRHDSASLTASDGRLEDLFSFDVAVSGNTFVVGAFGDSTGTMQYHGSVHIFSGGNTLYLPLVVK